MIYSLVVFSTVPLSLIGGIVALWLRGLPFSISAGVGFIALFGVAVLNGILMINHFNDLRKERTYQMCTSRIISNGCKHLLRPVFLTGLVASLGFVPMAIATSAGAEVQRPLATVVIGGLIVSTVMTLIIVPVFYLLVNRIRMRGPGRKMACVGQGTDDSGLSVWCYRMASGSGAGTEVSLDEALEIAMQRHPRLMVATAEIEKAQASRGEIWDGGNTSFSYSWGQLNGEYRKDHELSVEQSLGSLLTPFYRNALVNTQTQKGEYYRNLVRKEIVAEVKRAWAYYQYAYHLRSLYEGQEKLAEQLRESGDLRYRQGDIDLTERNMIATLASGIHTRWIQACEEVELAGKRFAWACYAGSPVVPGDTALTVLPCEEMNASLLSTDYFDV